MWRSFWANPGSKDGRSLNQGAKLQLLSKAVTPQLDFRCSRWPPQKMVVRELDSVHRKMVVTIQRVPKQLGEDHRAYAQRRGRIAGMICKISGRWSGRWFQRALDWNEHLERPRNHRSWASRLLHYHDRAWFIDRRVALLPQSAPNGSCLAGRTDTRAYRGYVQMRWHDGIEFAKACR